MIGSIISGIVELGSQWFQNKREKSQAKHEANLQIIANEATWEQQQAKNADRSWKDEYWTVIISLPFMAAFFPGLVPHIEEGFRVMDAMPEYYKAFAGASIAASFGIKELYKWKKK